MAPCQLPIDNSDEAQNSSCSNKIYGGCGRSKAQLSLQKILRTILTIPPLPSTAKQPSSPEASQNGTADQKKALSTDLNVGNLSVPPPTQMGAPPSTAVDKGFSTVDAGGSGGELKQEKVETFEETSNGVCQSDKKEASVENDHDQEHDKADDCMGLLIKAARMIFGEFKTEEKQSLEDVDVSTATTRPRLKRRNQSWTALDLYADMEPVVRSKRGRTQALPCKYRDSIVEPLTRLSRNRSSIIASKRKLR